MNGRDEGKMELNMRVTALLCKTSQQGERKERKGVCVGGRYERGGGTE